MEVVSAIGHQCVVNQASALDVQRAYSGVATRQLCQPLFGKDPSLVCVISDDFYRSKFILLLKANTLNFPRAQIAINASYTWASASHR